VIHDRRIDVPAPSDLPDGTEVLLTIGTSIPDDDGPMSPKEIARVLAGMQKIQPFDWTPEERTQADASRRHLRRPRVRRPNLVR
jgi:hypothetical protein